MTVSLLCECVLPCVRANFGKACKLLIQCFFVNVLVWFCLPFLFTVCVIVRVWIMFVFVCVCVYVCMYVCICVCLHAFFCLPISVAASEFILCLFRCVCVCLRLCLFVCLRGRVRA